jgi:hypothetical protein
MMTKFQWLYICDKNLEFICLINLNKKFPKLKAAIEAIKQFQGIGIQSNYKNPFNACFARNGEIYGDKLNSGAIKNFDIPIRYSTEELIIFLERIQTRGKDRNKRKIHQKSLNNLRKAPNWSANSRPNKPKKISEEMIDQAINLKKSGMSWRKIGDKLETNFQSIRTAINRKKLPPQHLHSQSESTNSSFLGDVK